MKCVINVKKEKPKQVSYQTMLTSNGVYKSTTERFKFLIIDHTPFVICDNKDLTILPSDTGWNSGGYSFEKIDASVTLEF